MKRTLTACTVSLVALPAFGGGLESRPPAISALFETGRYAEISFGSLAGDLSGTDALGFDTGNITEDLRSVTGAYKADINETLSYAVFLDQPFLQGVEYKSGLFAGMAGEDPTRASIDNISFTGLLRYKIDPRWSVFGGLTVEQVGAEVQLPGSVLAGQTMGAITTAYDLETEDGWGVGYVAGVAFEIPEYAVRASLTYRSALGHDLTTIENGVETGSANSDIPQSVTLEGQAPLGRNTLLFGSARWVDWSEYSFAPPAFSGATGSSLLSYQNDTITYSLGLGQRFNDTWSGFVELTYEEAQDEVQDLLAPTNGFSAIAVGAVYTQDQFEITTAVSFIELDDKTGDIGTFEDGSAMGVGIRVAYNF